VDASVLVLAVLIALQGIAYALIVRSIHADTRQLLQQMDARNLETQRLVKEVASAVQSVARLVVREAGRVRATVRKERPA
jgi:hypothetical protein